MAQNLSSGPPVRDKRHDRDICNKSGLLSTMRPWSSQKHGNASSVSCQHCGLRLSFACAGLEQGALDLIASKKTSHQRLAAKADVLRPGDPPALFTLYEGWLVRSRRLPGGGRQVLEVFLPGDLVGLVPLLSGMVEETVEAVTPSSVCRLADDTLDALVSGFPGMARDLMAEMAVRQRRLERRLLSMGQQGAAPRLAHLLLDLFDRLASRGMAHGNYCPLPLRRHHLADALGISETHVTRTAAELATANLAILGGGALIIPDRDALARFADYEGPTSRGPALLI